MAGLEAYADAYTSLLGKLNGGLEGSDHVDGGRLTEASVRRRLEECGSEESLTEEEKTAVKKGYIVLCDSYTHRQS